MARIVYVNGQYLAYNDALIHAEDRGFLFGDAVYEVCPVLAGRIIDEDHHLARLERSMSELAIEPPMSRAALSHVLRETVRRNRVRDGSLYLQVSRGTAPRNFLFPPEGTPRTVMCFARSEPFDKLANQAQKGIAAISGVEMFVQQGARQFEIWTGKPAPEEEMLRVVLHSLRQGSDPAEAATAMSPTLKTFASAHGTPAPAPAEAPAAPAAATAKAVRSLRFMTQPSDRIEVRRLDYD